MLRNKVVKTLRKAKADFFLRIINEARGNSKTIWNKLNYLKGDKRKDRSSLELMVNGKLTNNPADVAEALNYYFVDSVVTISQCFSPKYSEVYTVNTVEQALTLRAVSELDVTRTITSLKPSRAKDIFGMDVIMFKELSEFFQFLRGCSHVLGSHLLLCLYSKVVTLTLLVITDLLVFYL